MGIIAFQAFPPKNIIKMNYCKLLSVCAFAAMFAACSTSESEVGDGTAEVTLSLRTDGSHHATAVRSVAEETLPEIDDFTVEIFKNSTGARLYRDTYANSTDKKIRLNAGDYRLVAFHGDSLAAGFNAAYYQAAVPFTISLDQRRVNVSGTAKLANVKAAVNYGESLKEYYATYRSSLSTDKAGCTDTLAFSQTETRAGFIPAGNLIFKLFAKVDGVMKYYKTPAIEAEPNDFITINIDTKPFTGKVTIGVVIDNTVEVIEKTYEVDATDVASDCAPVITLSDDFVNNALTFYEAQNLGTAMVSIMSKAGYSHVYVDIDCAKLAEDGVPAKIDLLNLNEATKSAFEKYGIDIVDFDANSNYAGICFIGMEGNLKYTTAPFSGNFKVTAIDKNGEQTVSDTFSVGIEKSEATINASESNAYSYSIKGISVNVAKGDPERFALQYKAEGATEWTTAEPSSTDGNVLSFDRIAGLSKSTTYQFRAIYNGNDENVGDEKSLTTEDAEQVENAGFENWYSTQVYKKTTWSVGTTGLGIDEWFPKASESASDYWATRNDLTTSQRSGVSCYYTSYSGTLGTTTAHSGSYAAEISTVGWGEGNTYLKSMTGVFIYNKTAGMLYMGDYTLNADTPETYGRSFTSRPVSLTFYYKFVPINSEAFKAYIVVENRDNDTVTELARAELTSSDAVGTFTQATLDLAYSNTVLKATHMYIVFISSTADSPSVGLCNGDLNAFNGYSDSRYVGNVLTVDDIELIYD